MEFRQLGKSGLKVPVLSFGTGTFGGGTEFFKRGEQAMSRKRRGLSMFASMRASICSIPPMCIRMDCRKTILGKAVDGRRDKVLISTKSTFRMGDRPNDLGSSRHHLVSSCEGSLKRLDTDYIDIYHLHGFDALTPVEEVLQHAQQSGSSGKVRNIACSNFSGWHLMKSLAFSDAMDGHATWDIRSTTRWLAASMNGN